MHASQCSSVTPSDAAEVCTADEKLFEARVRRRRSTSKDSRSKFATEDRLQSLEAQMDTVKAQLAAGAAHQLASSGSPVERSRYVVEDEDETITSSADTDDIANMYSFCLEGAFQTAQQGRLAGLAARLAVVSALALIQVIYAFGYLDASQVMLHAHAHAQINANAHARMHTHAHTCAHAHMHTHALTYAHAHAHTHMHLHACTCTCTYACIRPR